MERTGLYRKLVTLLDQSPSLFIRNIRLQRAAQLLAEGKLSVTEIAERTRLQQFQLPKQMFSRNVWMPSLGIYRESEEINLIVVCFNIAIVRKTSFHPTFAVS